jgi:hypothetical protein
MRKGVWEMLARLPILTFDASSFKMAEALILGWKASVHLWDGGNARLGRLWGQKLLTVSTG